MTAVRNESLATLESEGFCLLRSVYSSEEIDRMRAEIEACVGSEQHGASIRNRAGTVYAARNLLDLWPDVVRIWQIPQVEGFLHDALGPRFGLVRVLYFDKPPEQTWALPWHKDLTIAIVPPEAQVTRSRKETWGKLTLKAGVPHVEADDDVLRQMLTLRIHLDRADEDNGALRVIPQSHRTGKVMDLNQPSQLVIAERGDVLAIRPLVSHCSGRSAEGTTRHRRILHLEFSAVRDLPFGFRWRNFLPARSALT